MIQENHHQKITLGLVAARKLMDHGYSVQVYTFAGTNIYKGDALTALKEYKGDFFKETTYQSATALGDGDLKKLCQERINFMKGI